MISCTEVDKVDQSTSPGHQQDISKVAPDIVLARSVRSLTFDATKLKWCLHGEKTVTPHHSVAFSGAYSDKP